MEEEDNAATIALDDDDDAVIHRVVIDNSNEHCRVMEFLLRTPIIDSILSYLPLTVTLHYGLARGNDRGVRGALFACPLFTPSCDKKSIAKRSLANVRSESRDKRLQPDSTPCLCTYDIVFIPLQRFL